MEAKHRVMEKCFDAEIKVDGKKLPLNHMMQETISNVIMGFVKTLKGANEDVEKVEVRIKKLKNPVEADAHTYP